MPNGYFMSPFIVAIAFKMDIYKNPGWDKLPDSKVHAANMGHIWGRQDPGGPHVGLMNLAIRALLNYKLQQEFNVILRVMVNNAVLNWIETNTNVCDASSGRGVLAAARLTAFTANLAQR